MNPDIREMRGYIRDIREIQEDDKQ